jgi:hypothetical protein
MIANLNLFSGHKTWLRGRGANWENINGEQGGPYVINRTVELNPKLESSLTADVSKLSAGDLEGLFRQHQWFEGRVDVVEASIPCTCFSVASIGTHWTKGENGELYVPKTEAAREAVILAKHTMKLIQELDPEYFIVENPRGVLRKLGIIPEDWNHATVWYCKYGDERAKPTDLWGRFPKTFHPRPPCYNGATAKGDCHHEPAPRGAKTGTQGRKNAELRSLIPEQLAEDWFLACMEVL